MIGSNFIETPQDIVARSQARTSTKYSADDRKNRDAFNDFLSSAERPGAADDQAAVARPGRKDSSAEAAPAEQAGGPDAGKTGSDLSKGEEGEETEADQAVLAGAILPGATKLDPSASATAASSQAAQQPQAGQLSANAMKNAGAAEMAAGAGGDQIGVELSQLSAQAAKAKAGPDHPAAGRNPAEKSLQPDAGAALKAAAAEGQAAPSAPTQNAAASLWGEELSLRQQKTARSEFAEISLLGRPSGDGQIGDYGRTTAREAAQPAHQVAVHIIRAVQSKQSVLRINLHPKELGQVDVALEMQDGRLKVTILAERPDALQQLQQNARALERALQEAGLNIGQSDFHFASRDGQSRSADRQTGSQHRLSVTGPAGEDDQAGTTAAARYEGALDISL